MKPVFHWRLCTYKYSIPWYSTRQYWERYSTASVLPRRYFLRNPKDRRTPQNPEHYDSVTSSLLRLRYRIIYRLESTIHAILLTISPPSLSLLLFLSYCLLVLVEVLESTNYMHDITSSVAMVLFKIGNTSKLICPLQVTQYCAVVLH